MKIPAAVNAANMSRGGSGKINDRRPSPSTRFPAPFLPLHAQKIVRISKKASKVEGLIPVDDLLLEENSVLLVRLCTMLVDRENNERPQSGADEANKR